MRPGTGLCGLAAEFHFLRDQFRENGHAVLNSEPLDIAMVQLAAILDERRPRRMKSVADGWGVNSRVWLFWRGNLLSGRRPLSEVRTRAANRSH
jgi:hypothetical protein